MNPELTRSTQAPPLKPLLLAISLAAFVAACSDSGTAAVGAPADDVAAPPVEPPTQAPPMDDDTLPADDVGDGDDTDDDASATIPDRFRGEWNTNVADCGTGNNASRLTIGADTIDFYESSGPVQSATADGNELSLVVRLTGEGETRDASHTFRLSDDGQTLTDAGTGLARLRCGS